MESKRFVQELTGEQKDEYDLHNYISELEYEMGLYARNLQFEKAAVIRDKIDQIKKVFSLKNTINKKKDAARS